MNVEHQNALPFFVAVRTAATLAGIHCSSYGGGSSNSRSIYKSSPRCSYVYTQQQQAAKGRRNASARHFHVGFGEPPKYIREARFVDDKMAFIPPTAKIRAIRLGAAAWFESRYFILPSSFPEARLPSSIALFVRCLAYLLLSLWLLSKCRLKFLVVDALAPSLVPQEPILNNLLCLCYLQRRPRSISSPDSICLR